MSPARAPPGSRPRRTSTRSGATRSAARRASTCPGTRAARARIPACASRSASPRSWSTCRPTSTGSTSGPAPTPFQRAEALAAEAHGAARSWFLTNGASQGNHALALALAPLGARVVVQRNSHASVVDGLVLSGGVPTYVAPEYEDELGMAHGVDAGHARPGARGGARRRAPPSSSRRPTTAWPPTSRRCAAVCHAAGVAARRRPGLGPALRLPSRRAGRARSRSAPTPCSPRRTRSSARSRSRRCCTSAPTGRIDPDAVARMVRLTRSTSPSALLMASLDAARRQLAVHGEALLDRTMAAGERARAAIDAVPGRARDRRRVRRPARASRAGTRCGS